MTRCDWAQDASKMSLSLSQRWNGHLHSYVFNECNSVRWESSFSVQSFGCCSFVYITSLLLMICIIRRCIRTKSMAPFFKLNEKDPSFRFIILSQLLQCFPSTIHNESFPEIHIFKLFLFESPTFAHPIRSIICVQTKTKTSNDSTQCIRDWMITVKEPISAMKHRNRTEDSNQHTIRHHHNWFNAGITKCFHHQTISKVMNHSIRYKDKHTTIRIGRSLHGLPHPWHDAGSC